MLIPTISITILYFIAKLHEASVSLYGPVLLGSYAITLLAISSFNLIEINSIGRTYELFLSTVYYLLYIGFMSIDF